MDSAFDEPPADPLRVVWLCGIGIAVIILAIVVGQGSSSTELDGPRVAMTLIGVVLTGAALSIRPTWPTAWGLAALVCLLACFGIPATWDSFRLLAKVLTAIAVVGLLIVILPRRFRWRTASLLVVIHLLGILTAISGEGDQPWLFAQLWARVYRPYLQFTNQNTSYHFFAPNPGAPSELWFGIEYDTPDREHRFAWVVVPRRTDSHDPLLNSYYRRIKIPEYAADGFAPTNLMTAELTEISLLRDPPDAAQNPNSIPHHPNQPASRQLWIPSITIQNLVLPSFVQHVAAANQRPGLKIHNIRVYRVLHDYITPEQFVAAPDATGKAPRPITPFDPTTYLAYYLGNFSPDGKLLSTTEALRWWMIPIIAKPDVDLPPVYFRGMLQADFERNFLDYVKQHAGDGGYRKGP